MNYVIVGACAAGLAAAEAVRKADAKGNITMLTEEAYFPYSRPSISYFLKGKVKENDMALRKPSFYKTNNINVITNALLIGGIVAFVGAIIGLVLHINAKKAFNQA